MDFVDSTGTRYQLTESAEAPAPAQKPVVWPWVVGGLAVAGGLVWMASSASRKANPVSPEIEALIEEARDPETSFERLQALVKHPEEEVRRALLDNTNLYRANHGQLGTILLIKLAEEFPDEVAQHPEFVLHGLIDRKIEMRVVGVSIAQLTEDTDLLEHLWKIWGTSSRFMRVGMAGNHNTSGHVLRELYNASSKYETDVFEFLAENPNTPEDILRVLGNEETESRKYVRLNVARNAKAPEDVLRRMIDESNESESVVRAEATNTLSSKKLK